MSGMRPNAAMLAALMASLAGGSPPPDTPPMRQRPEPPMFTQHDADAIEKAKAKRRRRGQRAGASRPKGDGE